MGISLDIRTHFYPFIKIKVTGKSVLPDTNGKKEIHLKNSTRYLIIYFSKSSNNESEIYIVFFFFVPALNSPDLQGL